MNLYFEKATLKYRENIFSWLRKPHIQMFWDNSEAHRADIDIFMEGRKIPSPYFDGIFDYWIGMQKNRPFCMMMSNKVCVDDNVPDIWKENLSISAHTVSLDFMIGEESFLGKGLAHLAINAFISFYLLKIDTKADTFFIDPDKENYKAIRAYERAGFTKIGEFLPTEGVFKERETVFMVKKCNNYQN